MGWKDYHLHEFEIVDPSSRAKVRVGLPSEDYDWSSETLPGWKQEIADCFSMGNRLADYTYDFGDNWEHAVRLEKIVSRDKSIDYPTCLAGERACPPEDCGGSWGYEEFLKAMGNPGHKEHKEMLEWVGGEFNPEHFDVKEIKFHDSTKRRKMAVGF